MSTTFDRLSTILQKSFNLGPERITADATLASLDIDSLGTVELLWQVEEVFRITIPAAPMDLATLSDVVQHIDRLVDQHVAQHVAQHQARPAAPQAKPPGAALLANPRHAP